MMNKIIKYGLIIVKDGKLLINRKFNTKLFLMPGGRPEKNETVEECLVREIMEEHKCKLIKESIKYFGYYEDKAANELDTIISMKVFTGEIVGNPKPSSEIEVQKWFSPSDNQEELSPIIRYKILPQLLERGII